MDKKKKRIMLKIFKLQLWITVVFFLAYIISISVGGKEAFSADLNNKKKVAGTAVSAMIRIFGPPEKPLISGNTSCNKLGFSAVNLNWTNAVDAIYYDVYRDGELIVSNLLDNFFIDESVSNNSSYNYYVVARGPAGEAISDEINFLTKSCEPVTWPLINFSAFDGKGIDGILVTNNQKPLFQGQTNIPFATIELEMRGGSVIYATTQTNSNGYWQWAPPINISYGMYVLYAKVIDPADVTRTTSTSLTFRIIEETTKREKEKDDEEELERVDIYPPIQNRIKESSQNDKTIKPFELDISLENEAYIKGISVVGEAYRGENLKTLIEFDGVTVVSSILVDINYEFIDSAGNVVAQYSQQEFLKEGLRVEKIISLPQDLKLGRYKLKISATIDSITVSNESMFILKDKPLLKIGATTYITYPDLVDKLSWLFIFSSISLSFFSVLVFWEHHLYKQALFHITEKILKRRGFIK